MKYLIIEDEDPAAARLDKMIREILPDAEKSGHLVSVKSAIEYLKNNLHPDLIFLDIQLGDGISFEIFKSVVPSCPVIFTTAYDQYAVQAFKVNSIDYLLKPVKREELMQALSKFKNNYTAPVEKVDYGQLVELLKNQKGLQKRFLIRFGDTIKAVDVSDVAYFLYGK